MSGFFGGSGGGTTNADDISSGTLAADYGGLGVDASALDGIVRLDGAGTAEAYKFEEVFEGTSPDPYTVTVVNDSGLYAELEKTGGGDIRFWLGDILATLDCTTGAGTDGKARVALTAGSDANNPQLNYLSVTASGATATLAASTSHPSGAFTYIAQVVVPDATTFDTTGAYKFHQFSDYFLYSGRGMFSHQREKQRTGAVWASGVTPTLNITSNGGAADNVHLATTAGDVYQLHEQTFPAFTTGPYYYGNGTNQYGRITDLASALTLEDGSAIGNLDRFNLVIWGAMNSSASSCKLFVNLPTGTYSKDADAQNDRDGTAVYSVPSDMRSVAFPIARLALKYESAASGTWTSLGVYSLLGNPVGVRAGGASTVASNEFSDGVFAIYNNTDPTKEIDFDASAVSTATTRTITMPDQDVDLTPGTGTFAAPKQVTSNVTAATTQTQGQGAITVSTGVYDRVYEVSTCATANDVVTLPADAVGLTVLIINNGAETLQVFPASGDTIDGLAANASTTISASSRKTFQCYEAGFWSV